MWHKNMTSYFVKCRCVLGLSKHLIGGGGRGRVAQWLAYLLPDSAALASIPSIPQKKFRGKMPMLLRLIDGAA